MARFLASPDGVGRVSGKCAFGVGFAAYLSVFLCYEANLGCHGDIEDGVEALA